MLRDRILSALLLTSSMTLASGLSAQVEPGKAVSVDSAAVIRDSLRRPPPRPPADAVNVAEFPFKVALYPAKLVVQSAAELGGLVTLLNPPLPVRVVRGLSEWGVTSKIRSIGPRSRAALVVGLHRFDPFFVESAFSVRGSMRHRVGVETADATDDPTGLHIEYSFQRDAQDNFWGVGKDSREENRSDFRREKHEVAARGWRSLGPAKGLVGVSIESNRVDGGNDDGLLDIDETFAIDPPFGSVERTKFVRIELSSTIGRIWWDGFSQRGISLTGGTEIFRGVDGTDADFHRFNGELRGYLPVSGSQTLALRVLSAFNVADGGGDGIPFFHLVRLGGSTTGPRSFSGGRFRDRFALSIQSEWRWGFWENTSRRRRLEAFVFLDEGAVSRTMTAFKFSDLRSSYGFGLRIAKLTRLSVGAYMAFGGGDAKLVAKTVWRF